jgi:hypothetical protein
LGGKRAAIDDLALMGNVRHRAILSRRGGAVAPLSSCARKLASFRSFRYLAIVSGT